MLRRQRILEFLKEGARTAEEIAIFFIGSSVARIPGIKPGMQAVKELRRERWQKDFSGESERAVKLRIQRTLQAMRADGLITSSRSGKEANYEMIEAGRSWLKKKKDSIPSILSEKTYTREVSKRVTLVVYDIPHARKKYRDWFRGRLRALGFAMLQRSVFVGKIKVPRELVDDLIDQKLFNFVEIVEITRQGTLRVLKYKSQKEEYP